jgi:hypothetical protein
MTKSRVPGQTVGSRDDSNLDGLLDVEFFEGLLVFVRDSAAKGVSMTPMSSVDKMEPFCSVKTRWSAVRWSEDGEGRRPERTLE